MPLTATVACWTTRIAKPPSFTTPVQNGAMRIELPDGRAGAAPQVRGVADGDGEPDAGPDPDGDGDADGPGLDDGAAEGAVSHVVTVAPIVETWRALPYVASRPSSRPASVTPVGSP